jgi:hypothetical protein
MDDPVDFSQFQRLKMQAGLLREELDGIEETQGR